MTVILKNHGNALLGKITPVCIFHIYNHVICVVKLTGSIHDLYTIIYDCALWDHCHGT